MNDALPTTTTPSAGAIRKPANVSKEEYLTAVAEGVRQALSGDGAAVWGSEILAAIESGTIDALLHQEHPELLAAVRQGAMQAVYAAETRDQ